MILSVGEALIDMVPVPYNNDVVYLPRAGGSPYNVAIALGRLGADVSFLGRVSTDPFGQLLREVLSASGVSLDYVVDTEDVTFLAMVQVVSKNKPHFTFYQKCGGAYFLKEEDLPPQLTKVDILHFGSISLLIEPGASAITHLVRREKNQRLISFDPNVRPMLIEDRQNYLARLGEWVNYSDVVKVSREDLEWLYPGRSLDTIAHEWLHQGPSLVIITLGEEGAIAFTPRNVVQVPAPRVDVVDTVGAGDAFTAALLFALQRDGYPSAAALEELSKEKLTEILRFAVRVGSLTCTRAGAEPPWRHELGLE